MCSTVCIDTKVVGEVRRGHLKKAEILRISDSCSM